MRGMMRGVERAASAYILPYETYRAEGIRGILFDIDNTLVMHGAPANGQAVALFARLRGLGFCTLILSNNGEDRVKMFADAVGADYVYKAGKPKRDGYLRACAQMGITSAEALMVGDQIFTDIWGARRSGMRAVLVEPIDLREELQIRLKRVLEKPVLFWYERQRTRGK